MSDDTAAQIAQFREALESQKQNLDSLAAESVRLHAELEQAKDAQFLAELTWAKRRMRLRTMLAALAALEPQT